MSNPENSFNIELNAGNPGLVSEEFVKLFNWIKLSIDNKFTGVATAIIDGGSKETINRAKFQQASFEIRIDEYSTIFITCADHLTGKHMCSVFSSLTYFKCCLDKYSLTIYLKGQEKVHELDVEYKKEFSFSC